LFWYSYRVVQYKYFVLYALAILIIGLAYLVRRWPAGIQHTFSQHAARQKVTIYYYMALFSIVLPILYVFFDKYFVPKYQLPHIVLLLVGLSSIAQIACAIIPETGGKKTIIHQTLAGISAVLLVGVLIPNLSAPLITFFDKVITTLALLVMSSVLLLAVLNKKFALPALLLQIVYFSAFFVAILWTSL
jgi:hypothetical protein